jgi:chemotaxis protein MotB
VVKHERWLVSYADFITLLFAFFVVLYASSQRDARRVAQLSAAIHGAFQQLDAFPGDKSAQLNDISPNPAVENARRVPEGNQPPNPNDTKPTSGSGIDVEQLRRELKNALGDEIKNHEIEMRLTPVGFVISLQELGFFNSGEAHLLPGAVGKLTRIANILNQHGFEIRVEGHTDNVPIHTAEFRSNWELSTARATEVIRMLIENFKFDPARVSVGGFGEYRPLESNLTPQGRQHNRRVDLVVVSYVELPARQSPNNNNHNNDDGAR